MGGQAADQPCSHRVWQVDKVIMIVVLTLVLRAGQWPASGAFGGAPTVYDEIATNFNTTSTIYNHC